MRHFACPKKEGIPSAGSPPGLLLPLLPTGNKTASWRKILSCFPPPPPPTTAIFAAHLRKKKEGSFLLPSPRTAVSVRTAQFRSAHNQSFSPHSSLPCSLPRFRGAERRRRIFKKDFSCGRGRQKNVRTKESVASFDDRAGLPDSIEINGKFA